MEPRAHQLDTEGAVSAKTSPEPTAIAFCCALIIAALVGGVGIPDKLVLRHIVQTLPLLAPLVLGFRRSNAAGWIALPLFLFWLGIMNMIWLYLLGVSGMISGHFSPLETAMTIVVAAASVIVIVIFLRFKSGLSAVKAVSLLIVSAALQFACFRTSFLPSIAHR